MDRRQFCKSSIAAGIAASYPFIAGCGERAKVATEADTSIAAIALDGSEIELEQAAIRELGEALDGPGSRSHYRRSSCLCSTTWRRLSCSSRASA